MRRRPHWFLALLTIVALMAAVSIVGCSDDDDDGDPNNPNDPGDPGDPGDVAAVTTAMQGIWSYTTAGETCDGVPLPDFSDSGIDTLCAGEVIYDVEDFGILGSCNYTETGPSSFRITCEESTTLGDCTINTNYVINVSFTSTTLMASGEIEITATGADCMGVEDQCIEFTSSATRTGDAPAGACDGKSLGVTLATWVQSMVPSP